MRRAVQPRLGSALRFSQPLSGFLADPSFAALFRAATVPGILPSESSPRKDRVPLSRPPCFPAVIHRRALACHPRPYYHRFHRLLRLRAVAWIPTAAIGFHSMNRSPLPGCPGPQVTEPPRSDSFTDFEASIPLRVRSYQTGLPRPGGRSSLGFLPLQSFLQPHLGSSTRPGLEDLNPLPRPKT